MEKMSGRRRSERTDMVPAVYLYGIRKHIAIMFQEQLRGREKASQTWEASDDERRYNKGYYMNQSHGK